MSSLDHYAQFILEILRTGSTFRKYLQKWPSHGRHQCSWSHSHVTGFYQHPKENSVFSKTGFLWTCLVGCLVLHIQWNLFYKILGFNQWPPNKTTRLLNKVKKFRTNHRKSPSYLQFGDTGLWFQGPFWTSNWFHYKEGEAGRVKGAQFGAQKNKKKIPHSNIWLIWEWVKLSP